MRILLALALASVALLSGCATTWVVDNDVQTFSKLAAVPSPATYRFERLPSQQSVPAEQAALEAGAQPALAKAGWVLDEQAARYSVQIGSEVQSTVADPWAYGRFGWGPPFAGRRFYGWYGRPGYWYSRYDFYDGPYYQRQVSVIIRDLATQQVVYETRAVHSARWPGDPALLAPMFDAALSSFPQPPAGVRRVNVEVPLQKQ